MSLPTIEVQGKMPVVKGDVLGKPGAPNTARVTRIIRKLNVGPTLWPWRIMTGEHMADIRYRGHTKRLWIFGRLGTCALVAGRPLGLSTYAGRSVID